MPVTPMMQQYLDVKEQNPERIDVDERYIILVFRENPDILRFRTAS